MKNLSRFLCVGAAALALGLSGCKRSPYIYSGKIGEEQVKFEYITKPVLDSDQNVITVNKSDGRIIKYLDEKKNDLKIEAISITKNGKILYYLKNTLDGKRVVAEGQKQFDEYLKNILDIKIREGLEAIK